MGHPMSPHFARSQRSRSPLGISGNLFQRAGLLILVGFLSTYTVVEYYSTRHVLSQCMELTTYGNIGTVPTLTAVVPVPVPSTIPVPSIVLAEGDDELDENTDNIAQDKAEHEKVSKIGKVTMLYGPPAEDETAQLIIDGHRRHAEQNNHSIHVLEHQILHGLWSKHAYLLSIMLEQMQKPENKRTQWLSWFDSDIIVMNPNIPLDIFLPPENDFGHVDIMFTNDHNGLNNGAFFIRVCERSVRFLVDCLALHTFRPEVKLKYSEQSAMEVMASDQKYVNRTIFVPQRWFNAYKGPRNDQGKLVRGQKLQENSIKPGDLQLHFAGKKTTKLLMPKWIDLAANESAGWAVPLEKTKLKAEIALFWKLEKERKDWNTPVASLMKVKNKATAVTPALETGAPGKEVDVLAADEVVGGSVPLAVVKTSAASEEEHLSEDDGE